MTTRTFLMIGGLILFAGLGYVAVFEYQACRAPKQMQRAVEELAKAEEEMYAAKRASPESVALRELTFRKSMITTLQLATNDVDYTDRIEILSDKLMAASEGDRSDPKIEKMLQALLDIYQDTSRDIDDEFELAAKLVREYRP